MKAKKIVYYLLAVTALTLTASACKPKIYGVGDVVIFKDMTMVLNSVDHKIKPSLTKRPIHDRAFLFAYSSCRSYNDLLESPGHDSGLCSAL